MRLHHFFFSVFCFLSFYSLSQDILDSAEYRRTYNSKWQAFQPKVGYIVPKKLEFQNFMTPENSTGLLSAGIRIGGPNNYAEDGAALGFEYYIPSTWSDLNDNQYKLQGFRFELPIIPIAGNTLAALKQFKYFQYALPINIYYGIGSMYLKDDQLKYKNFFFDLSASFYPRIVLFDRLMISSIFDFSWDITGRKWKPKQDEGDFDLGFKRTGYSYHLSVAWIFLNKSGYVRIY